MYLEYASKSCLLLYKGQDQNGKNRFESINPSFRFNSFDNKLSFFYKSFSPVFYEMCHSLLSELLMCT